jgi:hypothetical protein
MPESEKRQFNRKPIDFEADVFFCMEQGGAIVDRVVIVDISGSGVKFSTKQGDRYSLGAIVEIKIVLPEIGDVKAFMRGSGKVVRLELPVEATITDPLWNTVVAVNLDVPLRLERD